MVPSPSGLYCPRVGSIEEVRAEALVCTRCRLSEGRTNVVWADGNLDSDLLFIGEGPGYHEDQQGIPFVGAAGQLLDKLLGEIGLDRSAAAIVNVVKCRPPGNRDPLPDEIEACRPYLQAQLNHMQPDVIVTLGNFATRFVLEEKIGITKARGHIYERMGAAVIPRSTPRRLLGAGGSEASARPMPSVRTSGGPERHSMRGAVLDADGHGSAFERDAGHGAGRASSRPPFRGPRGARAAGTLLMLGLF